MVFDVRATREHRTPKKVDALLPAPLSLSKGRQNSVFKNVGVFVSWW
jgi:hypothetical protein